MPRRARVIRRPTPIDPKFRNRTLGKFISKVMMCGKRGVAEGIVYDALSIVENQAKRSPVDVFEQAIKNVTPVLEVKPRRVGGATYQVPVEVRAERRLSLAMRWILNAARGRSGKPMADRLASELLDAAAGQGAAVRRREETHRMADANKAFAHYRW